MPPEELEAQIDDETMKVGRRNSAKDQGMIQTMHDHAVSLGASCGADERKSAPEIEIDQSPIRQLPDGRVVKAMSLSEQVDAVRQAAYHIRDEYAKKLREEKRKAEGLDDDEYVQIPWELLPECVDVYPSYIIVKEGLSHYKVDYSIGESGITFATRDMWQKVEGAWIAKSLPEHFYGRPSSMMKSLSDEGRIGGYLVLWGDEKRRDVYREYFSKRTEETDAIFKAIGKLPALYQHAMDGAVKSSVVGVIDTLKRDDIGIWMEVQLDLANQYAGAIQTLTRQGVLGASSGTLPGARNVSPAGEILRWPIVEGSLTPTPAEPRMRTERPMSEIKAIYDQVGLSLPETVETEASTGDEESRELTDDQKRELERLRLLELSIEFMELEQ